MKTKSFRGYTITAEPNEDRDGENVYISKGRHSASLCCADNEGILHSDTGREADKQCPQSVIDAAYNWIEKENIQY